MATILFVCTGNTCRSCMAEAIAKDYLKSENMEDNKVLSAGVYAEVGQPASENAIQALLEKGLDLSEHRARQLTIEMVNAADLVLTMTRAHKNMVLSLISQGREKIFTLKEYVLDNTTPEKQDIADPFGGDLEVYRQTAQELLSFVTRALIKFEGRVK